MSKNIFLFSGQGSQYVGMAKELCEKYDAANAVFDTAEKVLGYDLRAVTFDGPDTELNKTVNSQPAIMACSLAAFEAAKAEGITFDGVAGHSLGEYAAMVAAGVVTIEDGFKLIKARAAAMQKAAEANSGSMYAIIGLPDEEVEKICEETEGYVVPVNYNSAVQTVIAGDTAACEAAAAKFSEMKKKAIKLNVASAFQSSCRVRLMNLSKLQRQLSSRLQTLISTQTFLEQSLKIFLLCLICLPSTSFHPLSSLLSLQKWKRQAMRTLSSLVLTRCLRVL